MANSTDYRNRTVNYCLTKYATDYSSEAENWDESGTTLAECGGAGGTAGTYTEILDHFQPNEYTVELNDDSIRDLEKRFGTENIQFVYHSQNHIN